MSRSHFVKFNFHSHTFCIWKEVPWSSIQDLKINYTSKSGSQYIFTSEGLYRISNHWGRVANCHWRLIPILDFKNQNQTVAYAKWEDFYSNNDDSKLFYIKMDWEHQEVNFYHKDTIGDGPELVLRNAKDTAKTIRVIKEVLAETAWAKYLVYDDINVLRKVVVNELINTGKSFLEVKKQYLT